MGRGWMHPGCSRSWDVGWLLAGPGNARHTTNSPGEQMLSSQCFLLFPIKFLFSRPEAITFACVFSKRAREAGTALKGSDSQWDLLVGFSFFLLLFLLLFRLFRVPELAPSCPPPFCTSILPRPHRPGTQAPGHLLEPQPLLESPALVLKLRRPISRGKLCRAASIQSPGFI